MSSTPLNPHMTMAEAAAAMAKEESSDQSFYQIENRISLGLLRRIEMEERVGGDVALAIANYNDFLCSIRNRQIVREEHLAYVAKAEEPQPHSVAEIQPQ